MREDEGNSELQAYISNLVSALGGFDTASPSKEYKLGDEALGCLRDVKKWLQLYDAKLDRWDVARAISETTLVDQDIIEILVKWQDYKKDPSRDPVDDRVALACLEILVPLTWPLFLTSDSSPNHWHHAPALKRAQARYKKAILTHPRHSVLKAVLRLSAGPLTVGLSDRGSHDEGILRLICAFFRNLLCIDPGNEVDAGLSAIILEFQHQKVLQFLITFGAGIGTLFDQQDTLILESIYSLTRGVNVQRLVMSGAAHSSALTQDLTNMLETEKQLRKAVFQPSRHSNFGTMISLGMQNSSSAAIDSVSVSGQQAISKSTVDTLEYIDESKKWRKPQRRNVDEREHWNIDVTLEEPARKALIAFATHFLQSAFNPTFIRIRRLIERDSERLVARHHIQYFVVVGWFLDFLREMYCEGRTNEIDFRLVGGVLNRQGFVVTMTLMRRGFETGASRNVDLVHATMISFRNLLLTVELMAKSDDREIVDIAEGLKTSLFYEETWLTLLAQIPRSGAKYTLAYACECVELTHVLLKMLDNYASQHTYLFVKSQRKRRKLKNRNTPADHSDAGKDDGEAVYSDEEDALHESARVTRERRFEFHKFAMKYANEKVLSLYERLLLNFRDVKDEHLKHVFSFFQRIFVKLEQRSIFYRMTLMRLIVKITSTREGLSLTSKIRPISEQFLRYYTGKLMAALDRTPSLYAELLFDKMHDDLEYFNTGKDKEVPEDTHRKFDYEFITPSMSEEQCFSIVVAALVDRGQRSDLDKFEEELMKRVTERGSLSSVQNLSDDKAWIRQGMNDPLLRLLFSLSGLRITSKAVLVPAQADELRLINTCQYIGKYKVEIVSFEDGKEAMDYLRRTNESRRSDKLSTDYTTPALSSLGQKKVDESSDSDADDNERFADARLRPSKPQVTPATTVQKSSKKRRPVAVRESAREQFVLSDSDGDAMPDELLTISRRVETSEPLPHISGEIDKGQSGPTLHRLESSSSAVSPVNQQHDSIPEAANKRQKFFVDDDSD